MKKNVGYTNAIALAKSQLEQLDPEQVALHADVTWDGASYIIPWLGEQVRLEDGTLEEQIIWMHYLTARGPKKTRERYISYKQVPGAAIYNDNFLRRCVDPMVNRFHSDLDGFLERGLRMGGTRSTLGHRSFTLRALPYLPLTYVLWEGDEEVAPNGNILFDESAIDWLCAEDLVVLAGLPVYRMLKMQ